MTWWRAQTTIRLFLLLWPHDSLADSVSQTLAPELTLASDPYGHSRIEWKHRVLFPPPPATNDVDHLADGHFGTLVLVGAYATSSLERFVFRAPGIDDCSNYGVWVLDVRDGRAMLRRVLARCIQGTVEILWWQPRAQVLIHEWTPSGAIIRRALNLD